MTTWYHAYYRCETTEPVSEHTRDLPARSRALWSSFVDVPTFTQPAAEQSFSLARRSLMFAQLFHYFLSLWKKPRVVTHDDLNRWDVSYDEPLTMFDGERVLVENGSVVGITAVVTDQHEIEQTPGQLPSGYHYHSSCFLIYSLQASFEEDKQKLQEAVNCMALVIIEHISDDGRITTWYGTAFFISPKLLLTAGHILSGPPNVKTNIRITSPGTPYFNVAALRSGRNTVLMIDCKVVATLYKRPNGPSHEDIAILDAGTISAPSYLRLSLTLPSLLSKVNVLGYPGPAAQNWLLSHQGIDDAAAGRRATEELFPPQRITITSGPIETIGPTISYKLSTVPGMSGGCVLHEGKVVGIS